MDNVNRQVLRLLHSNEVTFYSIDSVRDDSNEEDVNLQTDYPVEFLNTFNPPGFPPHKLVLKEGCIAMLLRNLSLKKGLCNGTRMIVEGWQNNVLRVKIVTGSLKGSI